jgi:hypothetical protein
MISRVTESWLFDCLTTRRGLVAIHVDLKTSSMVSFLSYRNEEDKDVEVCPRKALLTN